MKKTLLMLCCTMMCIGRTMAQNDVNEYATIITTKNDTIKGIIRMEDEKSIVRGVDITTQNGTKSYYKASEIKTLSITNYNIQFESITYTPKTTSQKQSILAKVLCTGKASLYKVEDNPTDLGLIGGSNPMFFIKTDKGTYPLLQEGGEQDQAGASYKRNLIYLLQDCKQSNEIIRKVIYDAKKLTEAINQYNNCVDPKGNTITYQEQKLPNRLSHYASVSGVYSPQYNPLSEGYYVKKAFGMGIGYFLDFMSPSISKKVSTNIGIQYVRFQTKAVPDYFTGGTHTSISMLRLPVTAAYRFGYGKVVPTLNAGFALETTNDKFALGRTFIHLGLGVNIDRVFIGANLESPFSLPKFYQNSVMQLQLAYAFVRKQHQSKYL